MWSYRQNVNLLVAGGNLPSAGNTGSGIYSGRFGVLAFEFSNMPLTSLVMAEVPRNPGTFDSSRAAREEENANVYPVEVEDSEETQKAVLPGLDLWKEKLNDYTTRFLNVSNATEFRDRICVNNDNSVCCEYDIAVSLTNITDGSVSQIQTHPRTRQLIKSNFS